MENLKLWTSYIDRDLFGEFLEKNILPVFIAKNISGVGFARGWQGTSVHFPELAPSGELLKAWKYGGLGNDHFGDLFTESLRSVNIRGILEKIGVMSKICSASEVVLLGYCKELEKDHRGLVANYIMSTGLLKNPIYEYSA